MPAKTTAPANPATGSGSVRVRMYRQGLGDCFLLSFPRAGQPPYHLVIDSGVIVGTASAPTKMKEVAQNILEETGGHIDALVVTHEHWDHVSGFSDARDIWQRFDIAEVWLAWTENPADALAKKLRRQREAGLARLTAGLAALGRGRSLQLDAERSARVAGLMGFFNAAADGAGSTREALDYIAKRGKKKLYHKPGTLHQDPRLPGVRIFVLGPPHDEKKIKKSDPSAAHPEVYTEPGRAFALADDDAVQSARERPFAANVGLTVSGPAGCERLTRRFFPTIAPAAGRPDWRRLEFEKIDELERLALALDGDTNNTSLALAFELPDGRVLLFPADAQVGNWLSWQDHTWKAGPKVVRADDLLARTVFYKVGHHGSHNATLKADGLEKMTRDDLIAFIPVNKAMAKKKRWNMPFPPLYQRLQVKTRGRVILADADEPLPAAARLTALTPTEKKRFARTVTATGLYIDAVF